MTSSPEGDSSTDSAEGSRSRTKHHELTAALRELVAGMRPGDKLPTQEALMRQFRVSDTTVLRSLEDLKREGRIVRRQGSGTFVADLPTPSAPPELGERGKMVAVLSRPSSSPFFADVIQAVEANLCLHDMAPLLIVDADRERRLQRARAYWTRGEILGAIHIGSAILAGLGDLPSVMIGETDVDREFCQVSLDNFAAGQRVGDYFWDLGHRRIVVLTIGGTVTSRSEGVDHLRIAGIRRQWETHGGTWRDDWQIVHPFLVRLDGEERRGIPVMRSYLEPIFRSPEPPTAVFAAHDEMAIVAIRVLEEMGLRVPEDVSVVGFNDSGTLAAYFRPSLTTVRTPSASFGTLAVHLLQETLRHPENRPRSIRLPAEIIVRESTGPAPSYADTVLSTTSQGEYRVPSSL